MWMTSTTLFSLLAIPAVLCVAALAYIKWLFGYFDRRKLPFLKPTSSISGSLDSPTNPKTAICVQIRRLYDEMKGKQLNVCGVYFSLEPLLFINNLDLLKLILTKDFDHFTDRGIYYNERDDPLSAHLFAIGGVKWRNLRVKLSPTFTSGKMKTMFGTLVECGAMLQTLMEAKYEKHEPVEIKDVLECFTTDIIGSCAFGLECNLFKDPQSPFRTFSKKVFTGDTKRFLLQFIITSFPRFARIMRLKQVPKDVNDFFMKVVKDTVDYRETNNVERKDFLQMLIEIKNNRGIGVVDDGDAEAISSLLSSGDGKTLTINEVAAQSFVFFLAGFETSSTLMSFALYELAKDQDVQDKVRREIVNVLKKHDGQITYDSINDLKYMNQVLDEALRKYPPVPFVTRQCVADYKLPTEYHNITIEKDEKVAVPIIGIHYDPEYYPDPERFDPDRFSEANKQARHSYAFLPFGEGPRICIGMRFGLMQSKVGITTLLKSFKFTLNPKTHQPLKFNVNSFIMAAEGGIWLDMEKV